jgi:hypothetical protein
LAVTMVVRAGVPVHFLREQIKYTPWRAGKGARRLLLHAEVSAMAFWVLSWTDQKFLLGRVSLWKGWSRTVRQKVLPPIMEGATLSGIQAANEILQDMKAGRLG